MEWLKFIFEHGFDSYDHMMKYGTSPQRIAAFHVRLFVKLPSLRWYVDLFFRCYFKLAARKRPKKTEQLCSPIPPQNDSAGQNS